MFTWSLVVANVNTMKFMANFKFSFICTIKGLKSKIKRWVLLRNRICPSEPFYGLKESIDGVWGGTCYWHEASAEKIHGLRQESVIFASGKIVLCGIIVMRVEAKANCRYISTGKITSAPGRWFSAWPLAFGITQPAAPCGTHTSSSLSFFQTAALSGAQLLAPPYTAPLRTWGCGRAQATDACVSQGGQQGGWNNPKRSRRKKWVAVWHRVIASRSHHTSPLWPWMRCVLCSHRVTDTRRALITGLLSCCT